MILIAEISICIYSYEKDKKISIYVVSVNDYSQYERSQSLAKYDLITVVFHRNW